jgi:predicted GNAT family N-acyltransferase
MVLKIEPLNSSKHIREDFCCGKYTLDNYIRKQASQDAKKNVARTYVLIDELEDELENHPKTKILGYYTLSNATIELKELDKDSAKNLPEYCQLPATLIGRLAVDRNETGKKLGRRLLFDALKKSLAYSKDIGSVAVVVESIDEQAAEFYLKYGFKRFNLQSTKLYFLTKSIEKIIELIENIV